MQMHVKALLQIGELSNLSDMCNSKLGIKSEMFVNVYAVMKLKLGLNKINHKVKSVKKV